MDRGEKLKLEEQPVQQSFLGFPPLLLSTFEPKGAQVAELPRGSRQQKAPLFGQKMRKRDPSELNSVGQLELHLREGSLGTSHSERKSVSAEKK